MVSVGVVVCVVAVFAYHNRYPPRRAADVVFFMSKNVFDSLGVFYFGSKRVLSDIPHHKDSPVVSDEQEQYIQNNKILE